MLPFREITLEDKPMVEHCGSHYNYHLCERCFVDLFMWRSHYNTQICFKDGFMLVKMSPLDGGHDCYLAPVGQGDLGAVLDALEQDAAERGLPFVRASSRSRMTARTVTIISTSRKSCARCPAKSCRASATSSTASRPPMRVAGATRI